MRPSLNVVQLGPTLIIMRGPVDVVVPTVGFLTPSVHIISDNTKSVKLLQVTAKSQPERWDHVVGRLRADRQAEQAYAAKVEELTPRAPTLSTRTTCPRLRCPSPGSPTTTTSFSPRGPRRLPRSRRRPQPLAARRGRRLLPRPRGPRPPGAGSTLHVTAAERPGKMTEDQKVERRLVVENNKAWRAAERVRRQFVRALLARKAAPKGGLRFATSFVVADPSRWAEAPRT